MRHQGPTHVECPACGYDVPLRHTFSVDELRAELSKTTGVSIEVVGGLAKEVVLALLAAWEKRTQPFVEHLNSGTRDGIMNEIARWLSTDGVTRIDVRHVGSSGRDRETQLAELDGEDLGPKASLQSVFATIEQAVVRDAMCRDELVSRYAIYCYLANGKHHHARYPFTVMIPILLHRGPPWRR